MKKLLLAALFAAPLAATAQDDGPTVTFNVLKPEIALALAVETMKACRAQGFQVGVAVVDRFGVTQVFYRDRFAGAHTEETAIRKAWTALSFRTDTLELDQTSQPGKEAFGVRYISRALPLGGGVMVRNAGELVGAVGVSGAPGGAADDACARKGIEAISDQLDF